jgi:hypothetical protein
VLLCRAFSDKRGWESGLRGAELVDAVGQ